MERARDLYGRMRLPLGLMGLERRWLGDEGNSASPARNSKGQAVIKLEKYKFYRKLVEFLEFIVSIEGISISPEKIKAIAK